MKMFALLHFVMSLVAMFSKLSILAGFKIVVSVFERARVFIANCAPIGLFYHLRKAKKNNDYYPIIISNLSAFPTPFAKGYSMMKQRQNFIEKMRL
jgi:hypothetical protein